MGTGSNLTNAPVNNLHKRKEQLTAWESSEGNKASCEIKEAAKVKFRPEVAFLASCSASDFPEITRFLDEHVDINTCNVDGLTALHQACIDSKLELIRFLIGRGADIHARDSEGWTPLHATALGGHTEVAKYLLQEGAKVGIANNDGDLPIDVAETWEMKQLLKENMAKIDENKARNAEALAMQKDARGWLKEGRYRNVRDPRSHASPLHVAAAKGYTIVLNTLLQCPGVDINDMDADGWTPLHAAAHWGQENACRILVAHGADMAAVTHATVADIAEEELVPLLRELQEKQKQLESLETTKKPIIANLKEDDGKSCASRRSSVTRVTQSERHDLTSKSAEIEKHPESLPPAAAAVAAGASTQAACRSQAEETGSSRPPLSPRLQKQLTPPKEDMPEASDSVLAPNGTPPIPADASLLKQAVQSAAIEIKEPTSIEIKEPTSIDIKEPISIEIKEPTSIKIKEPTSIDIKEPTSIDIKEPTFIDIREPTSLDIKQPAFIDVKEPTSIDISEPFVDIKDPTSIGVKELTSPGSKELTPANSTLQVADSAEVRYADKTLNTKAMPDEAKDVNNSTLFGTQPVGSADASSELPFGDTKQSMIMDAKPPAAEESSMRLSRFAERRRQRFAGTGGSLLFSSADADAGRSFGRADLLSKSARIADDRNGSLPSELSSVPQGEQQQEPKAGPDRRVSAIMEKEKNEESETERRRISRRNRATKRATQGVTADEVEQAKLLVDQRRRVAEGDSFDPDIARQQQVQQHSAAFGRGDSRSTAGSRRQAVSFLECDSGRGSTQLNPSQDSTYISRSRPGSYHGSQLSSRASSLQPQEDSSSTDYKRLYEKEKVANERLIMENSRLRDENEKLKRQTSEQRQVDKRLSEYEAQTRSLEQVLRENEKLKAENRALARVVARLSRQ